MSYINTLRGTAGAGSGEAGQAHDRFGRRIAIRLEQGSQELPHDISERLRAARVRAISQRKREAGVAMALPQLAAAGIGQQFGQGPGLWSRLASGLPVLVLAAGLVCIQALEADRRGLCRCGLRAVPQVRPLTEGSPLFLQAAVSADQTPRWRLLTRSTGGLALLGLAALFVCQAVSAQSQAQQQPQPNASASASASARAPASRAARAPAKPVWSELSESQKKALAPLAGQWETLSEPHKRTEARLNFGETQQFSGDEKKAKWEAYQALPPEEKRKLAASAVAKPPSTAAAIRPVPSDKLASVPRSVGSEAKPARIVMAAPPEAGAASAPVSAPAPAGNSR